MADKYRQNHEPLYVRLKGGLVPMTTLELSTNNLDIINSQLQKAIRKAPNFFDNTAIIVAIEALESTCSVDFNGLRALCEPYNITPVAIRGGNDNQRLAARKAGFGWLPALKRRGNEIHGRVVPLRAPLLESVAPPPKTTYLDRPLRSGQQIKCRDDVVVLATVSVGAEILTEGSIYCYAPMRGRLIAGINKNEQARIICSHFQAELVSISGRYRLAADINTTLFGKAVQVSLEGGILSLETLSG